MAALYLLSYVGISTHRLPKFQGFQISVN
jgi:hypothetical protein